MAELWGVSGRIRCRWCHDEEIAIGDAAIRIGHVAHHVNSPLAFPHAQLKCSVGQILIGASACTCTTWPAMEREVSKKELARIIQ